MENKPQLMILADDEFVRGTKKRYYNEFNDQLEMGNIGFITLEEAKDLRDKGELAIISRSDNDVFVLNPFSQQYIPIQNKNIESSFIKDKAVACKRLLMKMGAHCVIVKEEVKDNEKKEKKGGVTFKKGLNKGNVDAKFSEQASITLSTFMREMDLNNVPDSIEDVEQYIKQTGLINDNVFKDIFDDFRHKGKLNSTFNIKISFLSELEFNINIAAGIDFGLLSGDLNVSVKKMHVHKVTKTIYAYFGDVPEEVKGKFIEK